MKYNGLIQKMTIFARKIDGQLKKFYDEYENFKVDYPELNLETYKRYCRNVLKNNKIFNVSNDIIDIDSNICKVIKKRIAIISDTHCGHYTGLTPPSWQTNEDNPYFGKFSKIQRKAWEWFINNVNEIKEEHQIDVLFCNGDMIDGSGKRSDGTELITTDKYFQTKMAEEIINKFDAEVIRMTYGTPYHTGMGEDFEQILADNVGAEIEDQLYVKVAGKLFNLKHKVSNTTVPYSKATAIMKEAVIDKIDAINEDREKCDIIVRSHRHKMVIFNDENTIGIITPCMQLDTKYGGRQCSGNINYGFMIIDIYENGEVDVKPIIAKLKIKKFQAEEL